MPNIEHFTQFWWRRASFVAADFIRHAQYKGMAWRMESAATGTKKRRSLLTAA